jgi:hypothetical protein
MAARLNPNGNERLTSTIGALLLVPIVVELATILLGVHTFMSLHVFVGFVLIPAVLLKLASTGWRFTRYYTRNDAYRTHGPPRLGMRFLAPLLVVFTIALFASGVAMGAVVAAAVFAGLVAGASTVPAQHRWIDLQRDRHHRDHHDDRAVAG